MRWLTSLTKVWSPQEVADTSGREMHLLTPSMGEFATEGLLSVHTSTAFQCPPIGSGRQCPLQMAQVGASPRNSLFGKHQGPVSRRNRFHLTRGQRGTAFKTLCHPTGSTLQRHKDRCRWSGQ